MPLTWLDLGETGVIESIRANSKIGRHLCNLGLNIGEEVTVVSRNGENVIVAVQDCRLALNEKLALKVMVRKESSRQSVRQPEHQNEHEHSGQLWDHETPKRRRTRRRMGNSACR